MQGQWELHINHIRNYKGQRTLLVSTAGTFPHLNSVYSSRPQTALPMRTLPWRLRRRTGCAQVPLFTPSPTKWTLIQLAALDATNHWESCSLIWALPRRAHTQQPFTVSRVNNLLTRLVTHNLTFCSYFCFSHLWEKKNFKEKVVLNSITAKHKVNQGHLHGIH